MTQCREQGNEKARPAAARGTANFRQTSAWQATGEAVDLRYPRSRHLRSGRTPRGKRRRGSVAKTLFDLSAQDSGFHGSNRGEGRAGRALLLSLFLRLDGFSPLQAFVVKRKVFRFIAIFGCNPKMRGPVASDVVITYAASGVSYWVRTRRTGEIFIANRVQSGVPRHFCRPVLLQPQ